MQLPALKEKILQLGQSRRVLFVILLIVIILLFALLGGLYLYYFGYFRDRVTYNGPEIQGYVNREKVDYVIGTVVEKEDSRFIIENGDVETTIEIVGNVFYCGELEKITEETRCSQMDASEIKLGMYVSIDRSEKWRNDPDLSTLSRGGMFVQVWGLYQ